MKMKLLAMMLLAGGSMFAQSRFSVGVSVGGFGGGYVQQGYVQPCPAPYYSWVNGYCVEDYGYGRPFYGGGYRIAPRIETRYRYDNHFDNDRNRNFSQGRNQSSGDRNNRQGGGNRSRGR